MALRVQLLRVLDPRFYSAGCLVSVLTVLLVLALVLAPGEYTKTRGRWLLTALLVGGYCLATLGPAVLARRRRLIALATAGASMAALAFVLLLIGVWGTPDSDGFWKAAAVSTCLAVGLSYAAAALGPDPTPLLARRALRLSAMAGLAGVASAAVGIAFDVRTPPFWWALTLVGLVWAVAGLALPWAAFSQRR